ncbi:serine dehydratase [Bacillus sp. FJAT-18019]|nr:serine dehydratase [Bacillus sp. FJAT-18019]
MRFKDVFSIIGPSMVGPSSSHTAGAVRIGRAARRIFGAFPDQAEIVFYGSFADTYRGHGTDLAVVGGLLDFATDDMRIRNSIELAEAAGMRLTFKTAQNVAFHPNTVELRLASREREDCEDRIVGASIGGGSVEMLQVNGFDVKFTTNYPVLLVFHDDTPGMVAHITRLLEGGGVNIAYMDVDRKGRGGDAITVVESDEAVPLELMKHIEGLPSVHRVVFADLTTEEEAAS